MSGTRTSGLMATMRKDRAMVVFERSHRHRVAVLVRHGVMPMELGLVPEPRAGSTATARAWALQHLDQPLTLRELAAPEATSVRTLTRRFRQETGLSPLQWLTRQRIQRARQLLEDTDLPIDRIATDAGFGTPASLRQHLHTTLGVSPSAYRTTFRQPAGRVTAGPI